MSPIETILNEIERALDAKLYYLAIVLALTLPDICGALESKDGRAGPRQFKAWYNAHLKSQFVREMTDADFYSLRCGVLHQGRLGIVGGEFSRVIFVLPESRVHTHNCIINEAVIFEAPRFCRVIIKNVRAWFEKAKENKVVQANLPNLIYLRPSGLAPYMVGVPLIA